MTSSTPRCPDAGPSQTLHFNGYTIQMHDEKQEFSPAPVQADSTSKVSKKKTIVKKVALVLLLILGYLLYKFVLPIYYNSPYYPPWGRHDQGVIIGDTCSHDTGLLRSDLCRANSVKWDAPSSFSTASERFHLTFGRGNIKAKVYVQTLAQVQEPTLKMAGYVSPVDNNNDDVDVVPALMSNTNDVTTTEIGYQGVTLRITEDGYAFDVKIEYQDRKLVTPDGEKYCACAHLTIHVLLPESYTEYNQLFISGATADIEILDVENIGFKEMKFDVGTGSVISTGALVVDALVVDVKTGNIEIESIESTREGESVVVMAETVTGNVVLGANTKPATSEHLVYAGSKTGDVKVTVTPSSSLSSPWSKPADLDVQATTSVGDARALVELESRQQTLRMIVSSSTGSASALLSDDFTGELFVESKLGSAEVYEAEESESKIWYEKQTALVKEGIKTFEGQKPQEGRVNLQSSVGLVVLEFTK